MSHRKRPVHQTALPLLACIKAGRFTRAEVASSLGLESQNVTNWLARGIPAKQLSAVADLCGLTTDEFRFQAGLTAVKPTVKRPPPTREAVHDFDLLPGFLQNYIARKIAAILLRYEAVPMAARTRLLPPTDPDQLVQWEQQIESQILRLGRYREATAKA